MCSVVVWWPDSQHTCFFFRYCCDYFVQPEGAAGAAAVI